MRLYVISFVIGALATATLVASSVGASENAKNPAQTPAQAAEVSIPNTRRIDFVSQVNGHKYAITIALPFTPAPKAGYGVLYVLDGYWFFASAAEAVRVLSIPSRVVVVGIGYPDDAAYTTKVLAQRGPVPAALADL